MNAANRKIPMKFLRGIMFEIAFMYAKKALDLQVKDLERERFDLQKRETSFNIKQCKHWRKSKQK